MSNPLMGRLRRMTNASARCVRKRENCKGRTCASVIWNAEGERPLRESCDSCAGWVSLDSPAGTTESPSAPTHLSR